MLNSGLAYPDIGQITFNIRLSDRQSRQIIFYMKLDHKLTQGCYGPELSKI